MTVTIGGGGAATGFTALEGCAFHAWHSVAQTLAGDNVYRKINFDTEDFDYRTRYNNTGATVNSIPAYSFMPDVAGVYFIGSTVSSNISPDNYNSIAIYRNNINVRTGGPVAAGAAAGVYAGLMVYGLFVFNGTTDFVDIRLSSNSQPAGNSRATITGMGNTAFHGHLVRLT
jgi:hypothetical protein